MSTSEEELNTSVTSSDLDTIEPKNLVSYEVAVMCDKYNHALYQLFVVYTRYYSKVLFHSIDDHLDLLRDYEVLPKFISKKDAVNNYQQIAEHRSDRIMITTANLLNFEGFVECICRVALLVFSNRSLQGMYDSTGMKIAMFIEMWSLGDECSLVIHREERKQLKKI